MFDPFSLILTLTLVLLPLICYLVLVGQPPRFWSLVRLPIHLCLILTILLVTTPSLVPNFTRRVSAPYSWQLSGPMGIWLGPSPCLLLGINIKKLRNCLYFIQFSSTSAKPIAARESTSLVRILTPPRLQATIIDEQIHPVHQLANDSYIGLWSTQAIASPCLIRELVVIFPIVFNGLANSQMGWITTCSHLWGIQPSVMTSLFFL